MEENTVAVQQEAKTESAEIGAQNVSTVQEQEEIVQKSKKKFILSKKFIVIAGCILIALIAIACVIIYMVTRVNRYNSAVEYMKNGNYEYSIALFEKLGAYKDSETLLLEARTAENYRKATVLFSSGDFENAQKAFAEFDADYKDTAKYLVAIPHMQKLCGNWIYEGEEITAGGLCFKEYGIEISSPYTLTNSSRFSDCDWSVKGNVKMSVDRDTLDVQQVYTMNFDRVELVSHQKDRAFDDILNLCVIYNNKEYGKTLTGARGGYSKIFIQWYEDGEKLEVFERGCNIDFTTEYGSNGMIYFERADKAKQ